MDTGTLSARRIRHHLDNVVVSYKRNLSDYILRVGRVRLVLVDSSVSPRASLMIMNGDQPSLDQGGGGPVSVMRPCLAF